MPNSDLRATPSGERAIIGDVRGKGLQAVRTVTDSLHTDLPRHTRVFHDDIALLALAPEGRRGVYGVSRR
ncbi:hypothetical protein [Streptomyces nigrescens]|uniref:hypothetical protein n=1 Tax=Streptomyces nigrescens TaxID=1920 RepID=UPI00348BF968